MSKDKLEVGVKKTGREKELLTENCFLLKLISIKTGDACGVEAGG